MEAHAVILYYNYQVCFVTKYNMSSPACHLCTFYSGDFTYIWNYRISSS